MRTLFIHNTIAEYRVPFFIKLKKEMELDYVFTKKSLAEKIYGNKIIDNDIKQINPQYLNKGLTRYMQLFKITRDEKYDKIVIPPLDTLNDFIDSLVIKIASNRHKKKLIYFGEKWEAPKEKQPYKKKIKNKVQNLAMKFILNGIDLCLVPGKKSFEYFSNFKVSKINKVIDTSGVWELKYSETLKERNGIQKKDKVILYYGRIIERKGLDILIRAFENLNLEGVHLIICGDGGEYKEKCECYVKQNKIKNVIFKGHIKPKYKEFYFKGSDLFVLPSLFWGGITEAWGLTVNESLQCGTPVIATNAVGSAYDLLNGKNGIMINENSVCELEKAIIEILKNRNSEFMEKECKKVYNINNYENMVESFKYSIMSL